MEVTKCSHQIDPLCISRKFRLSLEDVKVVRGAAVGSGQHILLAKLKLKLTSYRKSNTEGRRKLQVATLQGETKETFTIELKNTLEVLQDLPKNEPDVKTQWN